MSILSPQFLPGTGWTSIIVTVGPHTIDNQVTTFWTEVAFYSNFYKTNTPPWITWFSVTCDVIATVYYVTTSEAAPTPPRLTSPPQSCLLLLTSSNLTGSADLWHRKWRWLTYFLNICGVSEFGFACHPCAGAMLTCFIFAFFRGFWASITGVEYMWPFVGYVSSLIRRQIQNWQKNLDRRRDALGLLSSHLVTGRPMISKSRIFWDMIKTLFSRKTLGDNGFKGCMI